MGVGKSGIEIAVQQSGAGEAAERYLRQALADLDEFFCGRLKRRPMILQMVVEV